MPYAYLSDGLLATCNKLTSVPEGVEYVEFERGALPGEIAILTIDSGSIVVDASKQAAKEEDVAKKARDEALASLVHNFGDGRVIQVRKQDEQNIRNAIELMSRHNILQQEWHMEDNTSAMVTITELQTALESGQDQGAAVWATFFATVSV